MKKFLWTLTITGALGAYAYSKRDEILKYLTQKMIDFDQTVEQTTDYLAKIEKVKENAAKFSAELKASEPVINSLTQEIENYRDQVGPLAKEIQAKLPQQNDRFS